MLRTLHRDVSGKVNALHFILAGIAIAACYVLAMYYNPYLQFHKIRNCARDLALQGSTVELDDDRGKAYYDSRMGELGYDYPMSEDLTYYRHDRDTVEVQFAYEYSVKHFFQGEPHILQFEFRCKAHQGHCAE